MICWPKRTLRWDLSSSTTIEEAIAAMKQALELDPFSLKINGVLGNQFFNSRQYDRAIEQHRNTLEMNPNNWHVHWSLGLAYTEKGMFEAAIAEHEKALALLGRNPFVLSTLGYTYGRTGRRSDARKILDELKKMSQQRYVTPMAFAHIHTGLGDKDQAFEWLEEGFRERSATMAWNGVTPLFDSLRPDPRFTELLRKMGLEK
jgi:Flp pilus assembly protein TadD